MSLAEGILRSSITSTVTSQPSSVGSTPMTPSGSLPVSSTTSRRPCCPASPAVSSGSLVRVRAGSLSSRAGRLVGTSIASCLHLGPVSGHAAVQPAGRRVLDPGQLVFRDAPGIPLPLRLFKLTPDPPWVAVLPFRLLADELRYADDLPDREEGQLG